MSKFKVGDRVRIKSESEYYGRSSSNPANVVGTVSEVNQYSGHHIRVIWDNKTTNVYREPDLELVQEKEMKYKLESELTLQQVYQLHCLTGQFNNMTRIYYETGDICEANLGRDFELVRYEGERHMSFQKKCEEIVNRDKRKVVKVGDKEYYEDELSKALSNINAIGE